MGLDELVSCIVLSYNKFDYLYNAIDSILEQNYPNIELIIFDDGSANFEKDKIIEYITLNFGKNISNLIVHSHEKNLGTVKNFNSAIERSKGKYILPLAGDDIFFDKNTLSDIVEFFKNSDFLLATAYRDCYSEDLTKFTLKEPNFPIKDFLTDPLTIYRKLCLANFITGACTYYTREFFDKNGLFDENYLLLEDYPKYLSFTRQGGMIGLINLTTIKYRAGGISSNLNPKFQKDLKLVSEKEIFPYKKMIGLFVYRTAKYDYNWQIYNKNILYKFINNILYIDIFTYRFLRAAKSKFIPNYKFKRFRMNF